MSFNCLCFQSKRAGQVDFRKVLSSSKRDEGEGRAKEVEEGTKIADVSRAKYKKEVDHTTVSTKRARHRGLAVPDKQVRQDKDEQLSDSEEEEEETPSWSKPEIVEEFCDITVSLAFVHFAKQKL